MADTDTDTVGSGPLTQVTHDDMTVVSNNESAEDMEENFDSEPKPKDGDPEKKPEEGKKPDLSGAASELGKKGGKASAKARAEEAEEPEKGEKKPEAKSVDEPKEETKPEEKPEPEGGEKPSRAKARIEQLAREKAEERGRRQELESQLERLQTERVAKPEEKPEPSDPTKPRSVDFPDTPEGAEQYLDARDAWNEHKTEERARAKEGRQRFMEDHSKFSKHFAPIKDQLSDEVGHLEPSFQLARGQIPTGENWIADAFWLDPEAAPALALHLSEHPDELQRIAALPTHHHVSSALTKLGAELEAATADTQPPSPKPEKTVSQAKPPVKPLPGSPQHSEEEVDDDTPFERHLEIMNAQDRRRGRGR